MLRWPDMKHARGLCGPPHMAVEPCAILVGLEAYEGLANASIQNISGLPQGLAGRPAAGWRCGRLSARASQARIGEEVPMPDMKRREFIALVGAGGLLLAAKVERARGQQPAMPVIGFLANAATDRVVGRIRAFHQGLSETRYVEGR